MGIAKTSALVLLSLAALIGISSAAPASCVPSSISQYVPQWYCSNINGAVVSNWYQWQPLVFIAITMAFMIAAVIFLAGVALRNERLRNFAIGELYEATATTIIAAVFLFLAAVVFGVFPAVVAGPVDPYSVALSYISTTLTTTNSTITNMFNTIMLDMFYGSISTTVTGAAAGATGILVAIPNELTNAIFTFFIIPARSVVYLLSDGLLILHTQFYLVLFFMYTAIPVFLIPGILLRAIFPLRNLGGIMIAIAIAFYLIMPVLFSVAYYFTNTGLIQILSSYSQQIAINGVGAQAQTNAATPSSPLVTAVQGIQNAMGSFWLSILFYPALIAAIAYQSIKIIADFIGGATKTTSKLRAV
ncbi:MAG: hypothetical protein KGH57_00595 [Candidatus Micrarchaeota archaeon]|nr:hypothetical protein [Candidatus Micrarchaeota archaeon]